MAQIYLLENEFNRVCLVKNTSFSMVRLLFLKYVTDNFIGAETKGDIECFARLQKQFATSDVGGGPNLIIPVLDCVDRRYNLNGLLNKTVNDYAKELFGLDDSWSRKSASLNDFEDIMNSLSKIDLEEIDENEKGKYVVKTLLENMQRDSLSNRIVSNFISRFELGEIAREILMVNDNETFIDFAAGVGSTTFAIVNDNYSNIKNYDVDKDSLSIFAMLSIMNGYKNFKVKCEDTLSNPDFIEKANKIFVDLPVNTKIANLRFGMKTESSLIATEKTIDCLLDNGIGVITSNSNPLYSNTGSNVEIKKHIIENRYLQAVISLPFTWVGSVANINIIVVSKKINKGVLFVNCNNKLPNSYVSEDKDKGIVISKEGLKYIGNIIKNNSEIDNISRLVSYQEIDKNNYNLMPNTYIKDQFEVEQITIEEIDLKLKELYAQLGIK